MNEFNEPRLLQSNPNPESADKVCCPFNTTNSGELILCRGTQCAAFRLSKVQAGRGYCKKIDCASGGYRE